LGDSEVDVQTARNAPPPPRNDRSLDWVCFVNFGFARRPGKTYPATSI